MSYVHMVDPLQRMVDKIGTEETMVPILKDREGVPMHQWARIEKPTSVV